MENKQVGRIGEDIATDFLRKLHFKIIGRNVIRAGVEADILAEDGKCVVIVEVKTKTSDEYGLPQEMVGPAKQHQLIRFAKSYLSEYGEVAIRIDVVAVTLTNDEPVIEHLKNCVGE
ncbi:MAG: YraN family protein [Patescibacteria group bacterium]|jgi:putative endonuclease